MVFSSTFFLLFFLPVFFTAYALVPKKGRNGVLFLFSLAFYAYGAPQFIWVLLASSLLNFYAVQRMYAVRERQRSRRLWLYVGLVLNVGLLLVFKYANFAVGVGAQWGVWDAAGWKEIALPIGISFFTFQSLSYNVDVYRGNETPLKKPVHYLIYIFSFPQMIAGPIVRFGAVAGELVNRSFRRTSVLLGIQRFIVGLSKKVLIANVVAQAFPMDGVPEWTTLGAWLALLAYTVQIYFDFSGYSDMAIGLGQMMGFHFPENFNRPYTARSFTDFWRRWHMTLSFWMRDYLYIGLGGNRRGEVRTYLNLLTVFVVSGFWHGASWNFLFWGLFHGAFLVLERAFLLHWLHKLPPFVGKVWTFFWVVLGWALFALVDGAALREFIKALFGLSGTDLGINTIMVDREATFTLLLAAFLLFFPAYEWWSKAIRASTPGWRSFLAHLALGVLSLSYLAGASFNPFIYFRF